MKLTRKSLLALNNFNKIHGIDIEQEYPVAKSLKVKFPKSPILVHLLNCQAALKVLFIFLNLLIKMLIKLKTFLKLVKNTFRVINVNKEERKLGLSLKPEGSETSTTVS